jgi:hypothetical protein
MLKPPPSEPKNGNHRGLTLRWSLFTLNKELRKIGLEGWELNLINLVVYRKTVLHLLGINATMRLSQIKKKRV